MLSFTDVDLFTANLSNYCFGYGIPAFGGVQSIRRFRKDVTEEEFDTPEDEESWVLQRVIKIATHELGHMFGMNHCTYYQCLMKGTNHLEQTDTHPPYFCPVCYRKLFKCLKFDHCKRYNELAKACEDFGYSFTEDNENEMNQQSYHSWFKKRYDDL